MAKPVIIASLVFPTKKMAKDFFRNIRDRYTDGERIALEDEGYLRDLVAIHPEAETKIGCGISHFTVATDTKFRTTRHFMIHRCDESSTDVSFLSAIDGPNELRDRYESLRRAIETQILDFRARAFALNQEIICPLRGIPVTESACHVDHEPPNTFVNLVDNWLAAENLHINDLQITPPLDNQLVTEMTDEEQRMSWQSFHLDKAKLRLLSPRGNLSDAKLMTT